MSDGDDFDPQAYLNSKLGNRANAPAQSTPVDPLQLSQFDPKAYLRAKNIERYDETQAKYGGLPQQLLAGVEGAARGVSLGTSDILEQGLNLSTAEAIKGRQEANPWTSGIGNVAGSGALIVGTGGLAAPIEGALGTGLAAKALAYGAEGAAFGAGSAISDAALGDPNMNSQKFLAHVGMGAAMGAGLGILSKGVGLAKALISPKAGEAVESAAIKAAETDAEALAAAAKEPSANDLKRMRDVVEEARKYGGQEDIRELPEKAVASSASSRLKDKLGSFYVTEPQLNSLNSQEERNAWKHLVQMPGEDGKIIQDYEGAQKKAAIHLIDSSINTKIAPGYDPTSNAATAGSRARDIFSTALEGKENLGPSFDPIKKSLAEGRTDEAILKKIFSTSETVKAAKEVLPPPQFNEILADHMAILRKEATSQDGVFSSKNFSNAMRRNQYPLEEAFGSSEIFNDIKDAALISRIFPDAIPANPSGTAPTLYRSIMKMVADPSNLLFPKKLLYQAAGLAKDKLIDLVKQKAIHSEFAASAQKALNFISIQGILDKVTHSIDSGAKSILDSSAGNAIRGGIIGGSIQITKPEFEKIQKRLGEFSSNPEMMMNHVADNTTHLYEAAPNITQSLSTSMFTGVQFLNSKLPKPPIGSQMPFSPKWEPSKAQMHQFSQYYQGVNDPLGVFKQVKNGSLSNNTMEALKAVHPQLLDEMRMKTMEHMKLEKAKKLPYSQKLSLSKFLGTPLDANMTGLAITNNQVAMNSPNQSQQTPQAQALKSTLGGMKELDASGRSKTTTDRDRTEPT